MGYDKTLAELKLRSRRLIGMSDGDHDPVVDDAIADVIAAGITRPRHVANMAMTLLGLKPTT
jgi:hypothetical protein